MLKLWQWDELGDNEVVEAPSWQERENPVTKEMYEGWRVCDHLPNGVLVFTTDRHFGCEVWAESAREARAKFMEWPFFAAEQEAYSETND